MKSKTLTYSRKQEYHHNNNYRSGRNMLENTLPLNCIKIRVGADKSLARRGRKKTTATRLGIYSTYSPRSSINFLTLSVGRKMATFQLFFQSGEQVVVRRGQIRRIGWVIKTLEAQVGQFLLGCKCPVRHIDSGLRHREVGRAKDLSAPPHTVVQLLVLTLYSLN